MMRIKQNNSDFDRNTEEKIRDILENYEDQEAFDRMEALGFSNRAADFILNYWDKDSV
jgi:hypothetical protein